MHYIVTADTDIGVVKETNQDSLLIKHGSCSGKEILMAIVCDGMGGLSKGELASATVIRSFSQWFDEELPYELVNIDMSVIGYKWSLLLKDLNNYIGNFGKQLGVSLGTTFSGLLCIDKEYVIVHVGDSRVYKIDEKVHQMTTDQTFVAREVRRGTMTPEQAKVDKRRNLLLQCVGASTSIEPQIITGAVSAGVYMLCSDGFRHEISDDEMYNELNDSVIYSKEDMHEKSLQLIERIKSRNEKDNISIILIKAE